MEGVGVEVLGLYGDAGSLLTIKRTLRFRCRKERFKVKCVWEMLFAETGGLCPFLNNFCGFEEGEI